MVFAAQVRGSFILEAKFISAWSDQLHTFFQNINKQFDNNFNKFMDKFTDIQHLRKQKTAPVVVTANEHVMVRRVFSEFLLKKKHSQVNERI